jgi:tetratricopeptide (TPR) repeat protein
VKTTPSTLVLALALALAGLGGCDEGGPGKAQPEAPAQAVSTEAARTEAAKTEAASTKAAGVAPAEALLLQGVEVQPRQNELSPQARGMAAYLAMMQAVSTEDEDAGVRAAEELASLAGIEDLPPKLWLECALWYMDRKTVNAIPFLKSAVRACPGEVPLTLALSEALSDNGFAEEAMRLLEDALAKDPENADTAVQLGITQLKSGLAEKACQTFEAVKPQARPGLADFYHAKALASLGRDAVALVRLREAVRKLPDFEEAWAEIASSCERTGDFKGACQAYERLLKLNVAETEVRLRLVACALKMNQPGKALAYFQQGPDDPSFQMRAGALFADARHYLQAEKLLKALAAREAPPPEVFLVLADVAFEQRHDIEAALAWLDKIPEASGLAPKKILMSAQLLAEAGETARALERVREGRAQFQDVPDFVNLETRILSKEGRKDEAVACARAACAQWPDDTDLAFLLGSLLAEGGAREEAFGIMEGIVAKEPDNYQALNFVGYTLAEENRDIPRALDLLIKANRLMPGQFYILDSLAWAHFRAGHADEAWTCIREAARLDKAGDPAIWEHFGDIALARGLKAEARDAYRKALEKKPDNAADIQRRLNAIQP